MNDKDTVVGVFEDQKHAQQAISELKRAGFTEEQIGVTSHGEKDERKTDADTEGTHAAQGAATGLAAGAGVGALWGLGIVAGLIPAIGPAIAGGTLAAILSSAGAGAAAAGLAGTLIGFGIPEEDAEYYEHEFQSGRTIVSVHANGQDAKARSILQQFGSYDRNHRDSPSDRAAFGSTADRGADNRDTMASKRTNPRDTAASSRDQDLRDERTMEVREEELDISKERVQVGEVDVHKEVHTEQRSVDVPVEKEEVVIERRSAGDRDASGSVGGDDESIRVPLSEEKVNVEKRPVVKEEVTVGKQTTERHEPVRTGVRKEEVEIAKRDQANERRRDR